MTNHVLLNSIDHKDIKIVTERSAEYGDNLWYAQTFIQEFKHVQAHYPIVFQKNPENDEYFPVALFGFKNEENLFLKNKRWDAHYIPLSVKRLPFYIGFQESDSYGASENQRVISIDLDSPRVSKEKGIDLFLEFGGNSQYLEEMANILETLHHGLQGNAAFCKALESLNLIESFTLKVQLHDGSNNQLMGFSTINEDALNNLSDDKLVELHRAGYLQAAYLMLASQVHFQDLVERKNRNVSGPM